MPFTVRGMNDAIQEAKVEAIEKAGGGAAVARELKLNRQAVYQWGHVPAEHVLTLEKLSGVSRSRLRPDLYPESETVSGAA